MRNWKQYWGQKALQHEETEFLKQVDRTIKGQPDVESVAETIDQILDVLSIEPADHVLDLCCGNGIITQEISEKCEKIAGVDFSESLIEVARKHFSSPNVTYYCSSILDEDLNEIIGSQFSKIYMLGSLQYFDVGDLESILKMVRNCAAPDFQVFFEGIPDIDRIWDFYNTEERRQEYLRRKERNEERIGTWWSRKEIIEICKRNGCSCEILRSLPLYDHYRFDIRIISSN